MSVINNGITEICAPVVNVNDAHVTLVEWRKGHGEKIEAGECVCVIETVKSTHDVFAEKSGVLFHAAQPGEQVKCGQSLGYIGPDTRAVEEYLRHRPAAVPGPSVDLQITPKAKRLCEQYNVDVAALVRFGVRGAVKEADVLRFLGGAPASGPEAVSAPFTVPAGAEKIGPLPEYNAYVARNLASAKQAGLFTTIETQFDLARANAFILEKRKEGGLVSVFHLFVYAVSRALVRHPQLRTFHHNGELYRYTGVDIGFVVKAFDKKLHSPVIRGADRMGLKDISVACQELALNVNRNKLDARGIGGACMNVSYIPNDRITRFVALPEPAQASILSLAVNSAEAKAVAVLNYDHTILDGWEAANFLSELHVILEEAVK